ncbi:TolC family protein [Chitinophaga horti]|uniref:TolC family protein n=1 Tax=Chitinophaga horti TaxID=2920382 RepID=A0ABY6J353_9BACT|nr:TolC family protein [Chitinophaga horti]UYQ94103.1 TolC family protein [Chitinophaga horti]
MLTTLTKVPMLIALCVLSAAAVHAQQPVLDGYIQQAFANNKGLQEQHFQLEKSMLALQQAKSLYGPNVALLASYNASKGGRSIDLPLGDLLNNAYSTLNDLTGSKQFPQLQNQRFQLNPENFYDTKLRTTLPLLDAEIYYNKKIRQEQLSQQEAAVNVYKRALVKDIKLAYYQYYQASQAVNIHENALQLIKENIRVNESLVKNGTRNNTAVYRSNTEMQKIAADINRAVNERENAKAYFNFLLNRQLTDSITMEAATVKAELQPVLQTAAIKQREEILQVNKATNALMLNEKMQRSYLLPKVNTFLDLGSQSEGFKFNDQSRYYFWGVNLQWNLFANRGNQHKIKSAAIDVQSVRTQAAQLEESLQLQLRQALNNYNTAVLNYRAAGEQLAFAKRYYRDQQIVYREGQLLYIELLDAQNQLTQAQLQLAISEAALQTAAAIVEREQAAYPLTTQN